MDLHMLNHPYIPGINPLVIMYNPFNVFLNLASFYSFHLYSSEILVYSFLSLHCLCTLALISG